MNAKLNKKTNIILIQAFKIAVGSSVAIYIGTLLNLQFATSAGIITLLTILTTRLETLKLSLFRIVTFVFSAALSWLVFQHMSSAWLAFGVYILFMVAFCESMGWKSTISVNSVVGTHFLTTHDFSLSFIVNEFLLILIGISIAIILNLFKETDSLRKKIEHNILYTEIKLKLILDDLAAYLLQEPNERNVWREAKDLEHHIQHFVGQSYEYHGNTMKSHADYYVSYFEMRAKQVGVLHSLHAEMKRMRNMPEQAGIVADYIRYLKTYVTERNHPIEQMKKLDQLRRSLKTEDLPQTHEEFESRALLYHILQDLEEFLLYKKWFNEQLDDKQKQEYWMN